MCAAWRTTIVREETDHNLLIRVDEAWRAARDDPIGARDEANAVIAVCGPDDIDVRVAALRVRGWAERVSFSHAEALATLDEGVFLAKRHRLQGRLAQVLTARASVRLELGDFAAARRDRIAARRALGGATSIELDAHEAVYEIKLGHHARAAELCRIALSRLGTQEESVLRYQLLTNLGTSLLSLGEVDSAERAYTQSARVAETIGRFALGFVTQGLGMAAVRRGDLPEALRRFDRSERILRETGAPLGEHYLDRIEGFMTLRLFGEAQHTIDRALRDLAGPGGAMLLAEVLVHQARLHLWAGRPVEAVQAADRAADLLRRQRRAGYTSQVDILRAEANLRAEQATEDDLLSARAAARRLHGAGFHVEAIDGLLVVAALARSSGQDATARRALREVSRRCRSGPTLLRVKGALADATLAEADGDYIRLRRAVHRGLADLQRFRSTLPTTELRALAAMHGVELTTIGLRSAVLSRRPSQLLAWMERSRVASALHAPPRFDDPELVDLASQLRELVAGQGVGSGADVDELRRLQQEQTRLERRLQRRLRTVDPDATDPGRVATAADVTRDLGESVLLEIAEVDGALVAVTLGGGRSGAFHALGSAEPVRTELTALLFGLRRLMRVRSDSAAQVAHAGVAHSLGVLATRLVAPLYGALAKARSVVVAPPASLFALPWHALTGLTDKQVSVAPSATIWRRAQVERRVGRGVLLVAGPNLPGAEPEVDALGTLYPKSRRLAGSQSTVREVMEGLNGAGLAHFACHGTFRADNPSFSSLDLADGPMTVLDLERVRRGPGVVVFAACDSGVSEALPGDELLGLVTSLFALGTRAAVASVVPVPDLESTPVMVALHTRLAAGSSIAEALSGARATLDPDSPAGLVTSLAFGCFGAGDATVGGLS